MHQHRFRIVIGGVGGGDFSGQAPQKCVSGIPGGGFQALFSRDDGAVAHGQGDVVAIAEIPDEVFIPLGFLTPEVMVEMGSRQLNVQLILE